MPKETNIIQQVLALIRQLEQERQEHQNRIDEIDSALAQVRGPSAPSQSTAPAVRWGRPAGSKNSSTASPVTPATIQGGRGGNTMSFREAVGRVTADGPLSVRDLVEAVQKIGYKFESKDPIKSVGAYLYGKGKKHFKRADGKFSLLGGSTVGNGRSATTKPQAPAPAKRTMSPAARKRIADAVRARWARQKAAAKK
jgi:hypothetical protein